jgi:hypothetical protein
MRGGDTDLPAPVYINETTFRTGYEMQAYAEQLGRAASSEAMEDAINERLGQTRKHYAEKPSSKSVGGYKREKRSNIHRVNL